MKQILFSIFFIPFFAYSQAPAGYYDGTSGKTGFELKSKLHDIISAKTISWHYGDLPNFYAQTDVEHHYDYDELNSDRC